MDPCLAFVLRGITSTWLVYADPSMLRLTGLAVIYGH